MPFGAAFQLQDLNAKVSAVEELLRTRPEVAMIQDAQGKLPLHLALRSGQPKDVVKLLLRANPNAAAAQDRYGALPLHIALSTGNTAYDVIADVLEAYVAGAGVEDKASGLLPVHLALMHNVPELPASLIKELLEAYPAGSLAKSPSGDTPMKLVMHFDHGSAVMEEVLKAAWKTKHAR